MLKFRIEEAMNGWILHINEGDNYMGRYIYETLDLVFVVCKTYKDRVEKDDGTAKD